MSGRAIASPTRLIVSTFSRTTVDHTSCGSIFFCALSTSVLPCSSSISATHCAAPCISGAIGKPTIVPPFFAPSITASGDSNVPPPAISAPMVEWKKSSWRHITPFGMPVVPPV